MAYLTTGPSKGNRRPTVAVPGSKGSTRPAAQKGGGGNKAAGSPEPTAATTPTVTVHSDGSVTAEHFDAGKAGRAAAEAAVARQRASEAHVRKVVALVTSKPDRKPVVAKGTKQAPANVGFSERSAPTRDEILNKESRALDITGHTLANRLSVLTSENEAPAKPKTITVAAHTRKAPEPKLKGTVQERKAARKTLQKAKKVVARTTGLTGPLTPSQKKFAEQVAKETGLSPRVVAAQALAEESGSAATEREAEGNNDWLNIGYYDSGPGAITKTPEWANPKSAAKATSEFFKGKKFGPSESIAAIVPNSAKKSDKAQIDAIGNSNWATSGAYRESIEGTYDLIGEKSNPGAIKDLKEAKLAAKELGLKVGQSPGKPTRQVITRYKAGLKAAETLAHSHLPYVWGGGHGSIEKAPTGLDCSGAVSWVLSKMGVLKSPLTSAAMGTVLKPGPGAVTVFYNAGHTFMKIGEKYFGTSVDDSSRGLSFYKAPPESYLNSFNVGHVPGLGKKEAIQLGFKLPSGANTESFPGMTVSSNGTTATIESGAGATQTKPGFSKTPIRSLSAPQRIRQVEATLKAGDLAAGKGAEAASTSTLDALSKKYGAAA